MKVEFDGVDFTDYFEFEGIQFGLQFAGEEGPVAESGEDLSHDDRVRDVAKFTCMSLTTTQKESLFSALKAGWITVKVTTSGGASEKVMRCTSFPTGYLSGQRGNLELWAGIEFEMVGKYAE